MAQGRGGCGCSTFIGIAVLGGVFIWYTQQPWAQAVFYIVVVLVIAGIVLYRRNNKRTIISRSREYARKIDLIASDLDKPVSAEIALKPGEHLIYRYGQVHLTEFKSPGSEYSGNTSGFGIGIADRLDYNFGWQEGSIQKLPEVLTLIDTGVGFITNQRVLFRGSAQVREWLFENFMGASDLNPWSTLISVSDRPVNSGLAAADRDELPPSLAIEIAWDFNRKGIDAAKQTCQKLSKELNAAADAQQAEAGKTIPQKFNEGA